MVLAILLSALVFSSIWWGWTEPLDKIFYDQLLQMRPQDPPADVIIVAIDEYSLSHIGEWPWSRRYHAELINKLTAAGVKAIGYDVVFAELNPLDPKGDAAFAQAIKENGNIVLPVYVDRTQLGGQLIEVLPHPAFAEPAKMGHVNTELDSDGLVRRYFQYEGIGDAFWPHFSMVVAQLATGTDLSEKPQVQKDKASPLVNVRVSPRMIPFLGGVGSFQQVSFFDVISGKVPARTFKDRIVFVGATSISLGDLLPTPVTVQGEQMPGVEINATIFEAERNQEFIRTTAKHWQSLVGVLVVLTTVLLIPRIAGRTSLLFLVVSTVVLVVLQALLLLRFDHWVPVTSVLIGQWLVYPLWTVLRLDQTLRYLQKQLVALHQELGHQSLVEHHADTEQSFKIKIAALMDMAAVNNYLVYLNGRPFYGDSSAAQKPMPNFQLTVPGSMRTNDLFCCCYQNGEKVYTLVVPLDQQANWNDEKERFLTRFFEKEFTKEETRYTGVYDLVFKYLNEVRVSQTEVNNARFLFEYCVNEMNDGVVIADEYGSVLFVNRLALRYLGVNDTKSESLYGLLRTLKLKNEESWQQTLFAVISKNQTLELEAATENGEELSVNLTYLDVGARRSNLIVVNLYDITRIKEAQRLRNETIDFLSHDMRSPMVSLLALVNQMRAAKIPEHFLNQIEQYANKNLYFAEQFLQLARVESDQRIQLYEIDFESIVQNAIDDVYSQAQQKRCELHYKADEDLFWVKGNGELLERAVVNLITNAIKYGPENTPIDIELKQYGQDLLFTVRDYGPGIPENQQALLFAPYQRLQNKTQPKQSGAGLGLRFVDVTIKRHGGSLYFESRPGRTEFGFTLPKLAMEL